MFTEFCVERESRRLPNWRLLKSRTRSVKGGCGFGYLGGTPWTGARAGTRGGGREVPSAWQFSGLGGEEERNKRYWGGIWVGHSRALWAEKGNSCSDGLEGAELRKRRRRDAP